MHQTTVRFGGDLWEALEEESSELGVSVAQFVREAALARLIYLAGRRGDDAFEAARALAGAPMPAFPEAGGLTDGRLSGAEKVNERARGALAEASALWAQGQQARRRAVQLREQISRRRDPR
jgi:hypothetical protein